MSKRTKCCLCDAEPDKIAKGLNKKLLGDKSLRLFCLRCLANYLEVSEEELLAKVEEFKEQGCTLFQ